MNPTKELIVVGAGGHARVVVDGALNAGHRVYGIIDTDYKGQQERILGCPVLGGVEEIDRLKPGKVAAVIAIGDNLERSKHYRFLKKKGFCLPSIIHPSATISEYAAVGKGTLINSGVILNAAAVIGENCIINSGAIVEHEVNVGDHCHIGPGVNIAGRTTIGDYTVIGIGARIIDQLNIGSNAIVGAGSVITHDIPTDATYAGVPGRRIK